MRAESPEIDTTLRMIETPGLSKGIKLKMKEYLDEIKPDFNWGLFLDIESEKDPTIH